MKILIDYQYHLSNNYSDFIFFSDLINELKSYEDIELVLPNSIENTIKELELNSYDIFQATGNMDYYLNYMNKDKKFVVYISDMISELLYEKAEKDIQVLNREIECKAKQIFLANSIITPHIDFKNTIKLLYSKYKDVFSITEVIKTGISQEIIEYKENTLFDIKQYILYIGQRNNPIDIYRFKDFVKNIASYLNENNLYLVSLGQEYTKDEINLFQELKIITKVIYVKNFSYINSLIQNSKCVIFTSVYTTLDLTILYTYKLKQIALLNDVNKIYHAIGGDFGCYFDFDNITHSLDTVLHLTNNEQQEIIENQLKRLTDFNIVNSTKTIYNLYKKLNENN